MFFSLLPLTYTYCGFVGSSSEMQPYPLIFPFLLSHPVFSVRYKFLVFILIAVIVAVISTVCGSLTVSFMISINKLPAIIKCYSCFHRQSLSAVHQSYLQVLLHIQLRLQSVQYLLESLMLDSTIILNAGIENFLQASITYSFSIRGYCRFPLIFTL